MFAKIAMAVEIAKFVLFLIRAVKDLVLQAEEQMPESGKGSEKFAQVKEAVIVAGKYAGFADDAIKSVEPLIEQKINDAVATEINK